jgi:hypothetical protein
MLLPFRPKPKENELLSSWLVRLARGYGMGIDDFLSSTGIGAHIRSFDCDRIRSGDLPNLLQSCTGTSRKSIEQTLLSTHICLPLSTAVRSASATWSWLIPLGYSHRSSPPAGFQICPHCLAAGEPYFRWQWRVTLYCRCAKHDCLLVNQCPQCDACITPIPSVCLAFATSAAVSTEGLSVAISAHSISAMLSQGAAAIVAGECRAFLIFGWLQPGP